MELRGPTIGTSVLRLLGESVADHPTATTAAVAAAASPHGHQPTGHINLERPYLLQSYDCKSILLKGPPKSGKTSLAMDMAYSCASIGCVQGCGENRCSCVMAIIYRIADSDHDGFPLQCVVKEDDYNETRNFEARYRQADRNADWDPRVLRRIRVRYMRSVRDLLADLLAMPLTQYSLGTIVIDDIDRMTTNGANPNASMMQILAVALDTSHALSGFQPNQPVVLATTEKTIAVPWVGCFLSIEAAEKQIAWEASPELSTTSKWQVTGTRGKSLKQPCTEYIVADSPTCGPRIYWRKNEKTKQPH